MRTFLVDLELDRVDLVKEGANTKAQIKLLKRKETQPMTFEEILKALKPEQAEVITKAIEDARKEKETELTTAQADLTKTKEDLQTAIADLAKAKETIEKSKPTQQEDELEVLMKSVNPALAKHIQTLQTAVDSMVSEKADQVAKQRFETVKAIPVEETKLKEVLKAVSPATLEVLQAASSAIEKSLLGAKGFESGTGTDVDGDAAYASLEKSAKKLQTENASLTYEQAFLKACADDPETYRKMK